MASKLSLHILLPTLTAKKISLLALPLPLLLQDFLYHLQSLSWRHSWAATLQPCRMSRVLQQQSSKLPPTRLRLSQLSHSSMSGLPIWHLEFAQPFVSFVKYRSKLIILVCLWLQPVATKMTVHVESALEDGKLREKQFHIDN
jgi:hypothetical protein